MSDDKIENCTLNRNWIWNGKEHLDIITWNAAIEAAVNLVQDEMGDPDNTFWIVEQIRKLKK